MHDGWEVGQFSYPEGWWRWGSDLGVGPCECLYHSRLLPGVMLQWGSLVERGTARLCLVLDLFSYRIRHNYSQQLTGGNTRGHRILCMSVDNALNSSASTDPGMYDLFRLDGCFNSRPRFQNGYASNVCNAQQPTHMHSPSLACSFDCTISESCVLSSSPFSCLVFAV